MTARKIAEAELMKERFREEVELEKAKLRRKRKYIFPWRIRVKIINLNDEGNK